MTNMPSTSGRGVACPTVARVLSLGVLSVARQSHRSSRAVPRLKPSSRHHTARAVSGEPQQPVQQEAAAYGWELRPSRDWSADSRVREVPLAAVRRPLQGTRDNDQGKVAALMRSIKEVGLLEPIDVLEVEGQIYGFSGCHRFEAHQRLGRETILCMVRKASRATLHMHLR